MRSLRQSLFDAMHPARPLRHLPLDISAECCDDLPTEISASVV